MTRGSKFFVEFANEKNETEKTGIKGRSAKLLQQRNEKIFYRFYYYSRILQYKYEQTLSALSSEFDLTESTVIQTLAKNANKIKEIGDMGLTRGRLKQIYPYMSWSEAAKIVAPVKRPVFELSDRKRDES